MQHDSLTNRDMATSEPWHNADAGPAPRHFTRQRKPAAMSQFRKKGFKKTLSQDDGRRKRGEMQVQLRKNKRAESLRKRRAMGTGSLEADGSLGEPEAVAASRTVDHGETEHKAERAVSVSASVPSVDSHVSSIHSILASVLTADRRRVRQADPVRRAPAALLRSLDIKSDSNKTCKDCRVRVADVVDGRNHMTAAAVMKTFHDVKQLGGGLSGAKVYFVKEHGSDEQRVLKVYPPMTGVALNDERHVREFFVACQMSAENGDGFARLFRWGVMADEWDAATRAEVDKKAGAAAASVPEQEVRLFTVMEKARGKELLKVELEDYSCHQLKSILLWIVYRLWQARSRLGDFAHLDMHPGNIFVAPSWRRDRATREVEINGYKFRLAMPDVTLIDFDGAIAANPDEHGGADAARGDAFNDSEGKDLEKPLINRNGAVFPLNSVLANFIAKYVGFLGIPYAGIAASASYDEDVSAWTAVFIVVLFICRARGSRARHNMVGAVEKEAFYDLFVNRMWPTSMNDILSLPDFDEMRLSAPVTPQAYHPLFTRLSAPRGPAHMMQLNILYSALLDLLPPQVVDIVPALRATMRAEGTNMKAGSVTYKLKLELPAFGTRAFLFDPGQFLPASMQDELRLMLRVVAADRVIRVGANSTTGRTEISFDPPLQVSVLHIDTTSDTPWSDMSAAHKLATARAFISQAIGAFTGFDAVATVSGWANMVILALTSTFGVAGIEYEAETRRVFLRVDKTGVVSWILQAAARLMPALFGKHSVEYNEGRGYAICVADLNVEAEPMDVKTFGLRNIGIATTIMEMFSRSLHRPGSSVTVKAQHPRDDAAAEPFTETRTLSGAVLRSELAGTILADAAHNRFERLLRSALRKTHTAQMASNTAHYFDSMIRGKMHREVDETLRDMRVRVHDKVDDMVDMFDLVSVLDGKAAESIGKIMHRYEGIDTPTLLRGDMKALASSDVGDVRNLAELTDEQLKKHMPGLRSLTRAVVGEPTADRLSQVRDAARALMNRRASAYAGVLNRMSGHELAGIVAAPLAAQDAVAAEADSVAMAAAAVRLPSRDSAGYATASRDGALFVPHSSRWALAAPAL